MSNSIRFTVVEKNSKQDIETYESEYRNLMVLLRDKLYLDGLENVEEWVDVQHVLLR